MVKQRDIIIWFLFWALLSVFFATFFHELGHFFWYLTNNFCLSFPTIVIVFPTANGVTDCLPRIDSNQKISTFFYLSGPIFAFMTGIVLTTIFYIKKNLPKNILFAFPVYLVAVACVVNGFLQLIQSGDIHYAADIGEISLEKIRLLAIPVGSFLIFQLWSFRKIKSGVLNGYRSSLWLHVLYVSAVLLFCIFYVLLGFLPEYFKEVIHFLNIK